MCSFGSEKAAYENVVNMYCMEESMVKKDWVYRGPFYNITPNGIDYIPCGLFFHARQNWKENRGG